jgi:hypothetical protein
MDEFERLEACNEEFDILDELMDEELEDEFGEELAHYGTPRHSGRYPWGSGDNPYQSSSNFRKHVFELRKQGWNDVAIAKSMDMNTAQLRNKLTSTYYEEKAAQQAMAVRLLDKGMSKNAAAKRMGLSWNGFNSLVNPTMQKRRNINEQNADILKKIVDEKGFVDIGAGSEHQMGITKTRLAKVVDILRQDGYEYYNNIRVRQASGNHDTIMKVLAKPGTTWADVMKNKLDIHMINEVYSEDQGKTLKKIQPPVSVDSKRVQVVYAEDGGVKRDGLIELRRGVEDISLKDAKYAQVRIAVDGSHYLKGMAVYSDNLPDGVDIRFNTNKHKGTPMLGPKDNSVLKPMKLNDPENPFGANIKDASKLRLAQQTYIGKDGKEHQSALNIVSEEGTWQDWGRSLASQFLGKQPKKLAERQLQLKYDISKDEFDEIMSISNPVVRSDMLNKFAGQCDRDAVHLTAAALPRQATKVLLPIPSLKDNEIYAPGYKDGEHVALVRFPHGGIFEIPTLVVNNKNREAKSIMENATDAAGINANVAERLSGADFDGDTALVIPCDKIRIRTKEPLGELKNFDPKEQYAYHEGMRKMKKTEIQQEMGSISNLITDMTIKGADMDEIARAVRHSMVVIDAYKHQLDYKRSEEENGIAELKTKWQGRPNAGASTLLSRSTSTVYLPEIQEKIAVSRMSPEEKKRWDAGEVIYEPTNRMASKSKERKIRPSEILSREADGSIRYRDRKTGEEKVAKANDVLSEDEKGTVTIKRWEKVPIMSKVSRMSQHEDAFDLVSGGSRDKTTQIEEVYADHANRMKALAQQARMEARKESKIDYDPSAAKIYADEVKSLKAKIMIAEKNQPYERKAQALANLYLKQLKDDNPGMDKEDYKKMQGKMLDRARKVVGAGKKYIYVEDKEWEAIQHGAVSTSTLRKVIKESKPDRIRELALPKAYNGISPGKLARAKAMLANGHELTDVAEMLDVAPSTLSRQINA